MKYWNDFLKLLYPNINTKDREEVIGVTVFLIIVGVIIGYMMWHGYM